MPLERPGWPRGKAKLLPQEHPPSVRGGGSWTAPIGSRPVIQNLRIAQVRSRPKHRMVFEDLQTLRPSGPSLRSLAKSPPVRPPAAAARTPNCGQDSEPQLGTPSCTPAALTAVRSVLTTNCSPKPRTGQVHSLVASIIVSFNFLGGAGGPARHVLHTLRILHPSPSGAARCRSPAARCRRDLRRTICDRLFVDNMPQYINMRISWSGSTIRPRRVYTVSRRSTMHRYTVALTRRHSLRERVPMPQPSHTSNTLNRVLLPAHSS